jgi:hypothetical protein
MRNVTIASVGLMFFAVACFAQELPKMPGPVKQHEMLQKLVGEWEVDDEVSMGPDGTKMQFKSTENIRKLGPFWIVSESKGTVGEFPIESKLTLGYDLTKNKIVGSWVDSVTSYQWVYEGEFDESGRY